MNILESADLVVLVLKHLPPGEIARCRSVNKKWCDVISNSRANQFWKSSYFTFVSKVMILDLPYRLLFAQGRWNVDFTLDIVRLLSTPFHQRRSEMLLKEGLLTEEQFEAMRRIWSDNAFTCFLVDRGLIALREHLINPWQVVTIQIYDTSYLWTLFHYDRGISALREGLITLEQLHNMPTSIYVHYLFNNDKGTATLRERLITPEQVANMPNHFYVRNLFNNNNGITALRAKLIIPEQVVNMPSYYYVQELLTNDGIRALRSKRITPEQIAKLDRWQDICPFIQLQLGKKMKRN